MFSIRSALVALAALTLAAAGPVERRQDVAGPHAGRAAFYSVGLGACGRFSQPSDFMTAVSPDVFNAFPGATPGHIFDNPICGRQATVTYQGKSITVSILDSCPTCGFNDLDLSSGAFKALAGDLNVGRIDVTWQINGL